MNEKKFKSADPQDAIPGNPGLDVWQFIFEQLSASVKVILLYVLESKGSSPGRQGFKMAVSQNGNIIGTIGGGIMEHKFVEMAKARLQHDIQEAEIYKQMHDKSSKNQSGMICSGEQTIFLYEAQQQDITSLKEMINSLKNNGNGKLQLSRSGIYFSEEVPDSNFHYESKADDFLLVEKTGYKNQLHIIGGGHCALALSKLMREMDFYIRVYDDRAGLNTMEQNFYAHENILLESWTELSSLLQSGGNIYVVIMTFGYRSDDAALRALLDKNFKYVGMLGSKKKIEKMFDEYKKEQLKENIIKHIHSPIGLQIKSQTAVEIAVSIAAEIIAIKNNDQ